MSDNKNETIQWVDAPPAQRRRHNPKIVAMLENPGKWLVYRSEADGQSRVSFGGFAANLRKRGFEVVQRTDASTRLCTLYARWPGDSVSDETE
jgi:hypothetical protein